MRRVAGIILNLPDKRGHHIERGVDGGKIPHDRHHAVVILQRMQTHPGHGVNVFRQVLVKGLVHVPKKHEVGLRHEARGQFLYAVEIGVLA